MNPRAFQALLRLEFRRSLTVLGRQLIAVAAVTGVVVALGWLNRSRLGMLVGVASTVLMVQGPGWAVRDKADGALEFLRTLPIPSVTLAASRLAFALLAGIPGGVGLAWGLWPDTSPDMFPGGAPGVVVATVLGAIVASMLATGCALRFSANQLPAVLLGPLFAVFVLDELTPRLLPDLAAVVRRVFEQPWFPMAFGVAGLAGTVLLAWLAFHLARTGIERFTPGRDRITW